MMKIKRNDDGDSQAVKLPVMAGSQLPSPEGQNPFYGYREDEEIQLRDYLDVIVRRKWLILTVFALTLLSTLVFTLASTKIYQAAAVIEVNQETPQVTKFEEVLASKVQAREFYETQVELLCSRAMNNRLLDKLDLVDHPVIVATLFDQGRFDLGRRVKNIFRSVVPSTAKGTNGSAASEDLIRRQKVIEYIAENLTATPSRKSMLITVAFRSPDRQLSLMVVNTLVDDFISWKMQQRLEASGIARDFLMLQIDRAKISLERAEEQLNQFAKQAGIVSLDARLNSIYRHLEELNSAIAAAEANMIAKKAAYEQAVKDGHANLPRVLESRLISNLKDRYAEFSSSYEDLRRSSDLRLYLLTYIFASSFLKTGVLIKTADEE